MIEVIVLIFFAAVCLALMAGYPVAFTLGGVSLIVAMIGSVAGFFDPIYLNAIPSRLYGVMTNQTLVAVPLFIFMGVTLERSKLAESLLTTMAGAFGSLRGGLAYSVLVVGVLMAASTGIVGATVVTMGLLSLPTMLKARYDEGLATGTICAAGTLGQIIPPSIVLVILGDVMSNAYQQAQLNMGIFSPKTVSVGELFVGALIPGLMLVGAYLGYLIARAVLTPSALPAPDATVTRPGASEVLAALVPPLLLIVAVLGSIMAGVATPTEAAAVGAAGALLLAVVRRRLNLERLQTIMRTTVSITAMVFMILIGASIFSLVFRGLGGDTVVEHFLTNLPGGQWGALLAVMALMFVLGFVLDFIEITFVVVPIVGPVLLAMGMDPIWLGILIAINLQTSFLTPPFGFALFYLRGVADDSLPTTTIYRGVLPFILIQLVVLIVIGAFPGLVTWLPQWVYGTA